MSDGLIRELLDYNPETGAFTWTGAGRMRKGAEAGYVAPIGYRYINLRNRMLLAHRIVFFLESGEWTSLEIDHINGKRDDNKRTNLRLVTHRDNGRNQANRSGGVQMIDRVSGPRWRVQVYGDGSKRITRTFKTYDEAIECRRDLNKKYGYTESHCNTQPITN